MLDLGTNVCARHGESPRSNCLSKSPKRDRRRQKDRHLNTTPASACHRLRHRLIQTSGFLSEGMDRQTKNAFR